MYNSGNSSKNVTGASIVDGTVETVDIADDAVTADKLANSVNTDIGTGVTASTTAGAALPKAGGAMTGTITGFESTGIDDNATSTAITIDASGNVGIGTSPSEELHLVGSLPTIRLEDTDNNYYSHIYCQNGDLILNSDQSNSNANSALRFEVDTTEKARITTDGLTFNGDTAAANALDDYEEGTWTPAVTDNTNTTTPHLSNGRYTKVGNQVTIQCAITNLTTLSAGLTGAVYITGVPYPTTTGNGMYYHLYMPSKPYTAHFTAEPRCSLSYNAGVSIYLCDASNITHDNSDISFSITYHTD
jgi:hypothetical protein